MSDIVHARLDKTSQKLLTRLRRQTGWNDSEIIRRAIRALGSLTMAPAKSRIVGMGEFESGVPDLGSNKKHLEGFGGS